MSRRPATARPTGSLRRDSSDEHNARHELLRQEMLQTLLILPVPTFDRLISRLLQKCGYGQVQVLSEAQGGADLIATTRSGLAVTRTLVQAKQYQTPVSRRFVDELRGAMLRLGASHGLLLTTSTFFGPALLAARNPGQLPVRLVDGEELLDLLLAHQLGVREDSSHQLHLDAGFFHRMEQEPLSADAAAPAASPRLSRKAKLRSLSTSASPIPSPTCRCWGLFRKRPRSDWQQFLG